MRTLCLPLTAAAQGTNLMPQTGLGVALKTVRERRTLSLREVSQLSTVDHAYVHRLETGEKTSPSQELVGKLLKVLKPDQRDAATSEMAR
jgi:transcriptional regulator with XRE-family HTH domain